MNFSLLGNENAKLLLKSLKKNADFSHAYLIHGQEGIGKKTFANMLILSVLCENYKDDSPCFMCSACKKFMSSNHPDVFILHGSSVQNSIRIDQIRNLRKSCYIKPNEAKQSIYLITNAQSMSIEAMNAFLKILEEPPSHAIFILTATSKYLLAQTIISRVVSVELFPISNELIKNKLTLDFSDRSDEQILAAIKFSEGVLGKAREFLEDENLIQISKTANEILKALSHSDEYEMLRLLAGFEKDKTSLIYCLKMMKNELRNILLYKEQVVSDFKCDTLLANTITKMQVIALIDFLQEAINILNTNANYNLTVAYICSKMQMIVD